MAENKGVAAKPSDLVRVGDTVITQGQYDVVVHTIAPGLDNNELELFFWECKRRGVHPMDRMIFPIKRNDKNDETGSKKLTFQCSIDLFRAQSEDTGKYLGQKPVEYGPDIPLSKASASGAGHDDIMVPEFATVTLLRKNDIGDTIEVPATAFWREYYPGDRMGFMWRKMPKGQLAKCAEALAHRKAFPRELGGLYANEEVERVDSDIPFAKSSTVREAQRGATSSVSSSSQKASSGTQGQSSDGDPGPMPDGEQTGSLPGFAVVLPPDVARLSNVKQSLFIECMTIAKNDVDAATALLEKASEFQGTGGKKFISLMALEKPSDQWCGQILAKLRKEK